KRLIDELHSQIHGIIHCTGGGQTKVVKFLDRVKVIKDRLFTPPPLFELIRQESETELKEMYQVFNMGHRLEVYLPKDAAQSVIDLANEFGIAAQVVGRVEAAEKASVEIVTEEGLYSYFE
ncbi:MAG: AIR synthase-related protein, partial [Bacteroidota bacterium]